MTKAQSLSSDSLRRAGLCQSEKRPNAEFYTMATCFMVGDALEWREVGWNTIEPLYLLLALGDRDPVCTSELRMYMRFSIQLSESSGLLVKQCHLWYSSSLVYTLNTGFLKCTLLQVHYISWWCGRGLCYGVKPNGDVVEQSCSKKVYCSETFRPLGSLSVTKRDQNVSLQLTLTLATSVYVICTYLLRWHCQLMNKIHVIQCIF